MALKVAVFGTRKYDIDSLTSALPAKSEIEFTFLDSRLDKHTAVMAAGHRAVCIFVNDVCDNEILAELSSLGVTHVALRCAGYNNVSLSDAAALNITVSRVPSYSPESVAEFAVGMILTVVRKYHKSYSRVREGNFLLDGLLGFNLSGKTVGIVGTGKIGLLTGRILARGFNCKVIAYDLFPVHHDMAKEHEISYVDSLEEMLRVADIVSLHCPLTESTRYMINEETLGWTKPGVILINTSRGALIESHALIRALKSGHLGAVGLDVYEKESAYFYADSSSKIIHDDNFARLISFYNVFVSGHQAFLTKEALQNIAETTIKNLMDIENGRESKNLVIGELVKIST